MEGPSSLFRATTCLSTKSNKNFSKYSGSALGHLRLKLESSNMDLECRTEVTEWACIDAGMQSEPRRGHNVMLRMSIYAERDMCIEVVL